MPEVIFSLALSVLIVCLLALWGSFGFWAMFWITAGCWATALAIIAGFILAARAILRKMKYL